MARRRGVVTINLSKLDPRLADMVVMALRGPAPKPPPPVEDKGEKR